MNRLLSMNVSNKIFIVTALIGALIPVFFILNLVGGLEQWNGIMPRGVTDSMYYYARIHEVADGYPLVGNPYLYEHRETYSPAFFLTDIISAVPLFFGLPFDVAIVVNIFFWSFVFMYLARVLLRIFDVGDHFATFWSIFLYLGSYSFILRPVVMQIIFPLFFCFLIAFAVFLFEPHIRKRSVILALVSATTFYFYSYLSFIVFFVLGATGIWSLVRKRMDYVRSLIRVGLYTTVFLIPFFLYSFVQTSNVLYAETLMRIGLVHTRIPAMEALFFGRWVVIGLLAFWALALLFDTAGEKFREKQVFWTTTGIALCIGLFMNVFTGIELTVAIHMGRFVILWTLIALGVVLHEWYVSRTHEKGVSLYMRHGVVSVLVLLLMFGAVNNIPRALSFFEFNDRGYDIGELQRYDGPLSWMEDTIETPTVVWANISLSAYVPVQTKHYVLFHNSATLHMVSSYELEERYLLWKTLDSVTLETLKKEFDLYAGAGPVKEQPLAQNNYAKFCPKLKQILSSIGECPGKTDALTLRGEEYFEELYVRYESTIQENQEALLKKYGVTHIIVDTRYDAYGQNFPREKALYDDGRFLIFNTEDVLGV